MKILVVHRQESILKGIRGVLRETEPYVRYHQSGLDGLLAARLDQYDLVICGTDLPVVSGYELARSIRLTSQNTEVPIVFIADAIDDKVEHLGKALEVAGMLMPSELSRSLPGLVSDTLLKMKYDIESSSPQRQN